MQRNWNFIKHCIRYQICQWKRRSVTEVLSNHLIRLRDPERKRNFQNPVHINRLKMAHIRAPNPQNYFPRRQKTSTSEQEPLDDTEHRSRNTDQIVTNHQESSSDIDIHLEF
jgi:hypothetical protein